MVVEGMLPLNASPVFMGVDVEDVSSFVGAVVYSIVDEERREGAEVAECKDSVVVVETTSEEDVVGGTGASEGDVAEDEVIETGDVSDEVDAVNVMWLVSQS